LFVNDVQPFRTSMLSIKRERYMARVNSQLTASALFGVTLIKIGSHSHIHPTCAITRGRKRSRFNGARYKVITQVLIMIPSIMGHYDMSARKCSQNFWKELIASFFSSRFSLKMELYGVKPVYILSVKQKYIKVSCSK
jgi:hypothetical protein